MFRRHVYYIRRQDDTNLSLMPFEHAEIAWKLKKWFQLYTQTASRCEFQNACRLAEPGSYSENACFFVDIAY
jgi:hypothetical protein